MFRAHLTRGGGGGKRLGLCRPVGRVQHSITSSATSCLVQVRQLTITNHSFRASRGIATSSFGKRVSPEAVAGAVAELRTAGLHVVGLYKLNPVYPKLGSAWFQPLDPSMRNWYQNFAFKCNLYRYAVVAAVDEDPDAAREVALKSRDFFWYSPILKETLRGQRGDAVVVARDEADVIAVAGCAARRGVPLVARGAGTGNYGQAVPLRGGLVLDLSALKDVVSFDAEEGVVRAGAGANLAELEEHVREKGWELRQHPSTRRTATLGGFIAGGSTGVGALLHGGLAEDGAVAGLRVVTAEAAPRVLELAGRDVFPVVHAYGTNGVITQVEIPLARAQPW